MHVPFTGLVPGFSSARTFSASVELDRDLLVHVLCEVQDVLLLGLLATLAAAVSSALTTTAAARASTPAAAAAVMAPVAATSATASVSRSLGHGVCLSVCV